MTAQSLLTGVVRSVTNGLVYGDWLSEITVLSIFNIKISSNVDWLDEILFGLDYEYEFDEFGYLGVVAEKVSRYYECCVQ